MTSRWRSRLPVTLSDPEIQSCITVRIRWSRQEWWDDRVFKPGEHWVILTPCVFLWIWGIYPHLACIVVGRACCCDAAWINFDKLFTNQTTEPGLGVGLILLCVFCLVPTAILSTYLLCVLSTPAFLCVIYCILVLVFCYLLHFQTLFIIASSCFTYCSISMCSLMLHHSSEFSNAQM